MKQLLTLFFAAAMFVSCSKDKNDDPQADLFATFQGKYLVCDMIKTTVGGITTQQTIGKGKGYDMSFGLYGNLDIYSTPQVSKKYAFESPDKVHYWTDTYQPDVYYTIQSMSGNNIVLIDTNSQPGKTLTEYFTAE